LVLPVSLRTNNPTESIVDGDSSEDCETYTAGFSEYCWGWDSNMAVEAGYAYAWRY